MGKPLNTGQQIWLAIRKKEGSHYINMDVIKTSSSCKECACAAMTTDMTSMNEPNA